MDQQSLLNQLSQSPETIAFNDVIQVINTHYRYTPANFNNGPELVNQAGTNEGSCKIFFFAKINELSKEQTLHCFGDYYRKDVLNNPKGTDHANIRNFMLYGFEGISFDTVALTPKTEN